MGPEQAQRIVHAVIQGWAVAEGLATEIPAWLEAVSVLEMHEAKAIVMEMNARAREKPGSGAIHAVPDDAHISAVHLLLHREPSAHPIVADGRGRAVMVVLAAPRRRVPVGEGAANDG